MRLKDCVCRGVEVHLPRMVYGLGEPEMIKENNTYGKKQARIGWDAGISATKGEGKHVGKGGIWIDIKRGMVERGTLFVGTKGKSIAPKREKLDIWKRGIWQRLELLRPLPMPWVKLCL